MVKIEDFVIPSANLGVENPLPSLQKGNWNMCNVDPKLSEEDKEFVNVLYTVSKKVTEEADIKFTPSKGIYDYVNECEATMEFLPVKEGNIGLTLKKMFDDHIEVDSKTLSATLKKE